MKKKLLAMLCMMVMVVGIFAMVATNANAADGEVTYKAGYAKVNITPWADTSDGATAITLISGVGMSGYGNNESRPATNILDDNGDGKKDRNDGIYATCTVLTEYVGDTEGKTLVFYSIDALNGYGSLTRDVRTALVTALPEIDQNCRIAENQVMVSGSHAHTAPFFGGLKSNTNPELAAYYKRVVDLMVSAAETAYNEKATATVERGAFQVADVMGCEMNFIRHYDVTTNKGNIVAGSNFGFLESKRVDSIYVSVQNKKHIAPADDTMDLVRFTVEGQDPIVLINWRAHPDNIGGNTELSSDYVNALRYRLENNSKLTTGGTNYRVSFIQGASGNLNATSYFENEGWFNKTPSASFYEATGTTKGVPFVQYGYLLGEAALECLEGDEGTWVPVSGAIRNMSSKHIEKSNSFSADEVTAAQAANDRTSKTYPYVHSGTGVILESQYHVNNILKYGTTEKDMQVELNTILIGDDLAFVSAPGEMFDRYDAEGSKTADSKTTGWTSLKTDSYGYPFVLGYSNGEMGYFPNVAAYNYNENSSLAGRGSYEAQSSNFEEGTGENLIAEFKKMLDLTAGKSFYCEGCETNVLFEALTQESFGHINSLTTGHYYLVEDIKLSDIVAIHPGQKVCLNLNGCTLERTSGTNVIAVSSANAEENAYLNIMDSGNAGFIQSPHQPIIVREYGVANMYGGNLNSTSTVALEGHGGTLYVTHLNASFTLHGGTIHAGTVGNGKYGGTVYLYSDTNNDASAPATFTMNGGTVFGGTACYGAAIGNLSSIVNLNGGTVTSGSLTTEKAAAGNCVYVNNTGKLNISSAGSEKTIIDNIYIPTFKQSILTFSGSFEGEISSGIRFANKSLENGTAVGKADNNAQMNATVSVSGTDNGSWYLDVSNGDLIATDVDPNNIAASIGSSRYETFQNALNAYNSDGKNYIKLNKNVAEMVTISKSVYLDLNGHNMDMTNVQFEAGTLYVMDSQTDDYEVNELAHTGYGKLTGTLNDEFKDDIKAVPVESEVAEDGYLMVTEPDIGTSFHRVNLRITHMSLRQQSIDDVETYDPGVYYQAKDSFAADAIAAEKITQFGIAMSVKGEPTETNLEADCEYSTFEGFMPGENANLRSGTLLTGVLKESNNPLINRRNANMPVYGSAYIFTEDGYMFGECVIRTFKDQMEGVDGIWDTLDSTQKTKTIKLYKTYSSLMSSWELPNLRNEMISGEDETISILGIGNSYTQDSMWMLGQIYAAENPEKNVTLGIAYMASASLANHVDNLTNDNAKYTYHKWTNATGWVNVYNTTMDYILSDAGVEWDVVSLQQSSGSSGVEDTYDESIQTIRNHVAEELSYEPVFVWNMTWAYPQYITDGTWTYETASNLWSFENNYQGSQKVMYQHIVSAVRSKIASDPEFMYLMPAGTAIQNANATLDDTVLYRDNTHLSDLGRVIAAYAWYCELEHQTLNEIQMTKVPGNHRFNTADKSQDLDLTDYKTVIAEAVRAARQSKFTTTDDFVD